MLIHRGWSEYVDILRDDLWEHHPEIIFYVNFETILYLYQGKKCDCIRTDMTSGAEIIGSVDKISYFDFFLYLLHDIKRIFINRHTFTISQRYRQIECMDMVLYRDTKQ